MASRLVEDGQPGQRQVGPGQRDELAFACGQCRGDQMRAVSAQLRDQLAQANRVNRGVDSAGGASGAR